MRAAAQRSQGADTPEQVCCWMMPHF
jgi:hypothetical protein